MKRGALAALLVALAGCSITPKYTPSAVAVTRTAPARPAVPLVKVDICDPSIENPHIIAECLEKQRNEAKSGSPQERKKIERTVARSDAAWREIQEKEARKIHRDQLATEYCKYQARNANIMTSGIIGGLVNGLAVGNQCIEFYQRTGMIPGQMQ